VVSRAAWAKLQSVARKKSTLEGREIKKVKSDQRNFYERNRDCSNAWTPWGIPLERKEIEARTNQSVGSRGK